MCRESIFSEPCDCCGGPVVIVLHPSQIKGMPVEYVVGACESCGLLQTLQTSNFHSTKKKSLSCDADWGNVRHGKKVRNEMALKAFLQFYFGPFRGRFFDDRKEISVLDVGSSRGDFAKSVVALDSEIFVKCIEPDFSLPLEYSASNISLSAVRLDEYYWGNKANCENSLEERFNYINLVHTLEHADSAKEMLQMLWDLGYKDHTQMFVEVPNFNGVLDSFDKNNVQEFFINKHKFHFTPETLRNLLTMCGFRVIQDYTTPMNISLLCRRCSRREEIFEQVKQYKNIINTNRNNLKDFAQKINEASAKEKVIIYGASQILDAYVKYGGLQLNDNIILVDDYLAEVGMDYNGKKIYKFTDILRTSESFKAVIFARSEKRNIRMQLRQYKHIEIMENE